MSDDEIAQRIGEAIQEREKARQRRGCLHVQMRKLAEKLEPVAANLRRAAKGETFNDFDAPAYPSAEMIDGTTRELRQTLRQISQLNDDLREMGISAPFGPE